MNEDLSALVFELQRAGSKVDKAKALARAWRTVRGLSKTERLLLTREVGFDGAEDLIEGLAGEGKGVFAPAAVLEALGKMRRDEGFSLRGILSDLRDPERLDDLFVRGIDLVAESVVRPEEDIDDQHETPLHDRAIELDEDDPLVDVDEPALGGDLVTSPPIPPVAPAPKQDPRPGPEPESEPEPVAEPGPGAEDPSPWDSMWQAADSVDPAEVTRGSAIGEASSVATTALPTLRSESREGSTLSRLLAFREGLESLHGVGIHRLREALDLLPEPWARRRALVALIEAGIPDEPGSALELIADMDRLMDRRWCLSALARRGDLAGSDLDRALGMMSSPAARRRVAALARM